MSLIEKTRLAGKRFDLAALQTLSEHITASIAVMAVLFDFAEGWVAVAEGGVAAVAIVVRLAVWIKNL